MLLLLLPGTPTTYYGEELGMRGISVSYDDTQDPHGKHFGPVRECVYTIPLILFEHTHTNICSIFFVNRVATKSSHVTRAVRPCSGRTLTTLASLPV